MIRRTGLRRLGLGLALLLTTAYLSTPVRGQGLTAIASFNGTTNGNGPNAGVTLDASGNLYGTLTGGGSNNGGTVWEIVKGSSTITTLASFSQFGGPFQGGVTLDANGNLFGTTQNGGAQNFGSVWEIAAGSHSLSTLASFNLNDRLPVGNATLDTNGNIFGTTLAGGTSNNGTVWELAKGSGAVSVLASFNGANGTLLQAGVTVDANGNLFGTAQEGGANGGYLGGFGTVWELAKGSNTITTLASFDGNNGFWPQTSVTLDAKGDIFGTTDQGGANGNGTIWEIKAGSGTITTLASIGVGQTGPVSGLTLDANGDLFGTSGGGGANTEGMVWELTKGSSTITTLASFDGTNGSIPFFSGVTLDANGSLFGTASAGGSSNSGTVWEIQGASVPEPSSIVTGLIGLMLTGGFVLAKRAWNRRSA